MTDIGSFVLPTEKKPKQNDFPNLKRGQSILNERKVISIEATGHCFCWKFYEHPRFRGKTQFIYPGDRYIPETSHGSLKRVVCPEEDYDTEDYIQPKPKRYQPGIF